MTASAPPSPLQAQLEHYVRALRERDDHPEERQDLGTFVMWLLLRSGYTIRLAPLHYDGPRRRVSKGRYQGGVDLVASRPSGDDAEDLFLFVLKPGKVGRDQWRDSKGIIGDLNELGDTEPKAHERWLPLDVELGRVVIVVCHNGEFDAEALADKRRNRRRHIEERGFGFEWWSAPELVERARAVLAEGPDDQLFPPAARPYYGLLLDGLATTGHIPRDAVERLLDARLRGPSKELARTLSELSLFAAMMAAQPRAHEDALLDLLDMMIAIITRSAAAIVAAETRGPQIQQALADLLTTFVAAGQRLAEALAPLADAPDGLSLAGPGEQIDWPLRVARIVCALALSARSASELIEYHRLLESRAKLDVDRESARARAGQLENARERCQACCVALSKSNIGALATPITDDQLIEYSILWRTLLDMEQLDLLRQVVTELLTRWMLRRRLGYPGPALYQHARIPMLDSDIRVLVEAWHAGRLPSSFEDGGSTLLPVVLALVTRLQAPIDPTWLAVFKPLKTQAGPRSTVYPQSWSPPEDASQRWYGEALSDEGVCHVHQLDDLEQLVHRLFELHAPVPASPMDAIGLASIDAMAWIYWRTRPPPRWLLDALPGGPPDA